jgi:hypothetical protein
MILFFHSTLFKKTNILKALDIVVNLMDKDEKCEIITDARHAFGALGK